MDNKLILAKSITLLYRESQLTTKTENSSELVRTILETVQIAEVSLGTGSERDTLLALKTTALDMCSQPQDHIYDKTELLQRLRINCSNDDKLFEGIKQGIQEDLSEAALKRTVINLTKTLNTHYKNHKISLLLSTASSEYKFNREKIKDPNKFITELISQLEPLSANANDGDPAVMGDINFDDAVALNKEFETVKQSNTGLKVYKTGWQDLNETLQGGFRPGETWVFGALQHKYKTGFSLSIFLQIARYNTPLTEDKTKKPLLLRISFEDSLTNNLQFAYQQIQYTDTREPVDLTNVTTDEMAETIKTKLQVNGFHIKMMRVDPNQWTYRHIINKVLELEAEGYALEVLMLDYLYKVPKTGCIQGGPAGNDIMDQQDRIRQFCASKGILFITPHQLSTEAKALLRGGMPEENFVKEIAEKGYWEGCKGLDRVFDGGLLLHLFKRNGKTYFTVQRDKHRLPNIIDEEKKYFIMEFPKGMPIPDDINTEKISFRKMSSAINNSSSELFSF